MIFKRLSIENIRSYKTSIIEFPLGTSLFEGDVGSGKSTILMAIEFALFGLGNQKGDSLLRKGTEKGSVFLEFKIDDNIYQIERILLRKDENEPVRQYKGVLSINGEITHLSPSEIKEKILEILNFKEPSNPRAQSLIFRYAIYTPQEEMKSILTQKPDLRLQTLRKAFGIEDYKIAAENSIIISKYFKDKIIYLEGQTADLDIKKGQLTNLKQKNDINEINLRQFVINGEKFQEKLEDQKKELEELQKLESYINQINAQIPHLKKQIEDKNQLLVKYSNEKKVLEEENNLKFSQIENLKKMERPTLDSEENLKNKSSYLKNLVDKRKEILVKLSFLTENSTNLEKELLDHENKKLDDFKTEKSDLISQIEICKATNEELKTSIENISKNRYKLEAKKQEIQDKIENLEGLGDLCPICDNKLDRVHKLNLKTERNDKIKHINEGIFEKEELEKLENKKLENLETTLEGLQNNLEDIKFFIIQLQELKDIQIKIEKLNEDLRNLDSDIILIVENEAELKNLESYVDYFENLLNKLREFNRNLEDLESLKYQFQKNIDKIDENKLEISKIHAEVDVLNKNLSKSEDESKKLDYVLENIIKTKITYDETDKNFQLIKENIISLKTVIKGITEDIDNLIKEIDIKEKLKDQYNKLYDYQIWLKDYLIPTLSLIEKHIMHKIHEEFNIDFQKWFRLLIDDITKNGRIDEEFTPIIEQDDFEQEINYLSGGEKTSVALAYRLALNNIVQKVSTGLKSNMLILDEPTDGFSKEQLYKVRDILNELDCPQIIIVSHERELESFANNIFRIEKIDGTSKVISV